MDIQIPEDAMRQIVQGAIMQALSAEKRDELLRAAITKLITPEQPLYGGKKESMLEAIFKQEVSVVARESVISILKTDNQIHAALTDLVVNSLKKAVTDESGELVDSLSKSIAYSMRFKE